MSRRCGSASRDEQSKADEPDESRRHVQPRLGYRLLERQPRTGSAFGLIRRTEALAGARDQLLVSLPFVQEHPEAEPAFLVLRDSPKTRGGAVVALLEQRTRDAGDAVDLHAPASSCDGVIERFGKALQRRVGIPTIEREVSEAVQRARQLLLEAAFSRARCRLLKHALTLVVVPTVAVRVTQPVELRQE